jgi:hypothetical protein
MGGANPYVGDLWDDVRMIVSARTVGANAPSLEVFRDGLRAWRFDNGASLKEIFLSAQLPHSYLEGSDIRLHVHWAHVEGSDNGNVVWSAEYAWASNLEAMPASATPSSSPVAVSASQQYMPIITPIATLTGTGKRISSLLLVRLFRDPTVAGDTSTANVYLLEADLHFQKDSVGTVNETAKP